MKKLITVVFTLSAVLMSGSVFAFLDFGGKELNDDQRAMGRKATAGGSTIESSIESSSPNSGTTTPATNTSSTANPSITNQQAVDQVINQIPQTGLVPPPDPCTANPSLCAPPPALPLVPPPADPCIANPFLCAPPLDCGGVPCPI